MQFKNKLSFLILGILLGCFILIQRASAQNFQGVATYLSDRDMSKFAFNGNDMNPETTEALKAQLKKQFQKEFELKFNRTESTWAQAESLDGGAATAASGGMVLTISMGSGLTYKNTETNTYLEESEAFGKTFLVSDKLEEREWKMTGASKKIGNYTVFEAYNDKIQERLMLTMDGSEKKSQAVTDTMRIRVWYTPEIPVPHGPESYWGLPGLILELNDGNVSYHCTKVVLNPAKEVAIKAPTKGRKVTREEYKVEMDKMQEEMMKKYAGGEDGENVMTIQIGN